jgi:CubicO group peptidase (beta-lactamase class C family)
MNTLLIKHFFILLLLLGSGCNSPRNGTNPYDQLTKKIDYYIHESIKPLHLPGLTVAATSGDSIVYSGAFGFRNVETKELLKTTHVFHWASVSKTFVAMAMMQLAEKGKINLDDKLIAHLPYFKQEKGNYQNISIRQMLNHTSGIGDVENYEWEKPQNDDGAPERYVRSLVNDTMLFPAGQDWAYSNTAYDILGVVIAKISGMSFETYIQKNILQPLKMNHSTFIYHEIPDSLRVKGHGWSLKPVLAKNYPYNKIHAPSSTLNSSVLDMTHYAMANLRRGEYKDIRILADSSYNVLWTNSVKMQAKPKVGLGWFINEYKGLKVLRHNGGDLGFRSVLLLVPEKNISIAMACNYEYLFTEDLAFGVVDILLGENPKVITQAIGLVFMDTLMKEGVEKAKAVYKKIYADPSQRKYFTWKEEEGAMSQPGFMLWEAGKLQEALEVFKFNQELNPTSGNAYGLLGIAYAKLGNKKLARLHLEKSLELIPEEAYFKKELIKLEK